MASGCKTIKNVSPQAVFQTKGNTGFQFPHNQCEIPSEPVCPLCLQENRQIEILTDEGNFILVDCRD